MPWILYDPDDNTYLCEEMHGKGADDDLSDGLWQKEGKYATEYDTEQEALTAIEEIDVEDILLQIVPLWRAPSRAEQGKKRWEDMTHEERMAQVEEDFEDAAAARVQRHMMMTSPRRRKPTKPIDPARLSTITGRLMSAEPARQYISRPRPIQDPIWPIHGSASDMVRSPGLFKQLKEITKDMKIVLPKAPPPFDPLAYDHRFDNDRFHIGVDMALEPDYASLELRVLAQLKERDNDGRQEEGPHELLYGWLHDLGGAPRSELPSDEGNRGSGESPDGSGG